MNSKVNPIPCKSRLESSSAKLQLNRKCNSVPFQLDSLALAETGGMKSDELMEHHTNVFFKKALKTPKKALRRISFGGLAKWGKQFDLRVVQMDGEHGKDQQGYSKGSDGSIRLTALLTSSFEPITMTPPTSTTKVTSANFGKGTFGCGLGRLRRWKNHYNLVEDISAHSSTTRTHTDMVELVGLQRGTDFVENEWAGSNLPTGSSQSDNGIFGDSDRGSCVSSASSSLMINLV